MKKAYVFPGQGAQFPGMGKNPMEIRIQEALNFVRLNKLMAITAAATCKKSET
jgi:malonyl CoA-acyl carrier protein transacylase